MHIVERVRSPQGAMTKYLQKTRGDFVVETSYIKQERKHIICASTQVGCAVQCQFCASGLRTQGKLFHRSLSAFEIVEQCLNVVEEIDFSTHNKPLLFSLMGEGEPFLNFDACVESFRTFERFARLPVPMRFAISTSGIRPDLIEKLGEMHFIVPLKLQVSVQAPNDKIRRQLVPVSKPIAEIISAVRTYRARSGGLVDLMYVLCAGVNDQPEHARELAELLGPDWHVKFNRLNPTPGTPFSFSAPERLAMFRSILEKNGISTEYYETDEGHVNGGCGQLSYHSDQQKTPHRE